MADIIKATCCVSAIEEISKPIPRLVARYIKIEMNSKIKLPLILISNNKYPVIK